MHTGTEISAAFMQQNDKKSWKATNLARQTGDLVHFTSTNGMVTLIYYCNDNRFAVKFNKYVASWGDYTKAIARAMFTVLNTLKSAGLPFDAPANLAGMVIECTTTETTEVFVRYKGEVTTDNLLERMDASINAELAREAVSYRSQDGCPDEGCPHYGTAHSHPGDNVLPPVL
jgi:hypothetical protein